MEICGKCLHDKQAHEHFNHNEKFMYCGICNNICDMEEFKTEHKPSDLGIISTIQAAREFSPYKGGKKF